jgi:hypothetical protein
MLPGTAAGVAPAGVTGVTGVTGATGTVGVIGAVGTPGPVVGSPTTLIALPVTEIGAVTSGAIWVPPRVESDPVVVDPGAVEPEGAPELPVDPDALPEDESPTTLIALPVTAIGAVTSGATWVPPRVESDPVVVGLAELPEPAALPPEPPVAAEVPEDESPSTLTALPFASTGAVTSGTTWVPDAVPFVPVVDGLAELPEPAALPPKPPVAAEVPEDECPRTR